MNPKRLKLRLVTNQDHTSGSGPVRTPMPAERETLNPAPDKDYSREVPSTEGEENDPEVEDE
jgi:hypothetical protein